MGWCVLLGERWGWLSSREKGREGGELGVEAGSSMGSAGSRGTMLVSYSSAGEDEALSWDVGKLMGAGQRAQGAAGLLERGGCEDLQGKGGAGLRCFWTWQALGEGAGAADALGVRGIEAGCELLGMALRLSLVCCCWVDARGLAYGLWQRGAGASWCGELAAVREGIEAAAWF